MANTTRIKDLSAVTSVADTDVLPVDGANGTKGVTFGNLSTAALNKLMNKTYGLDQGTKTLPAAINELYTGAARNNAGGHNSIFRGKNLGTSYTSAMSKAIQAGTFDDLFVGDYLTINGTVYQLLDSTSESRLEISLLSVTACALFLTLHCTMLRCITQTAVSIQKALPQIPQLVLMLTLT